MAKSNAQRQADYRSREGDNYRKKDAARKRALRTLRRRTSIVGQPLTARERGIKYRMAHPEKKHPTTAAELDAITRSQNYATLVEPIERKLLKVELRLRLAKVRKEVQRLQRQQDKLARILQARVHLLLEGPPVPPSLEVPIPKRFRKEPSI